MRSWGHLNSASLQALRAQPQTTRGQRGDHLDARGLGSQLRYQRLLQPRAAIAVLHQQRCHKAHRPESRWRGYELSDTTRRHSPSTQLTTTARTVGCTRAQPPSPTPPTPHRRLTIAKQQDEGQQHEVPGIVDPHAHDQRSRRELGEREPPLVGLTPEMHVHSRCAGRMGGLPDCHGGKLAASRSPARGSVTVLGARRLKDRGTSPAGSARPFRDHL